MTSEKWSRTVIERGLGLSWLLCSYCCTVSPVVAQTVVVRTVPRVSRLVPNRTVSIGGDLTITIEGSNFTKTATVMLGDEALNTIFVSDKKLLATIPSAKRSNPGKFSLRVVAAKPAGGRSNTLVFTVVRPAPRLEGITPETVDVGAAPVALTVTGSGFLPTSEILCNGVALPTVFVSPSQLTTTVPAAQRAVAKDNEVAVKNPLPGGGISGTFTLTVMNPTPELKALSVAEVHEGAGETIVHLTGNHFQKSSTAAFNGTPLNVSFVSPTELTATVPATLLAKPGAFDVSVSNPAPGGGDSTALTFVVQAGETQLGVVRMPAPVVTRRGNELLVTVVLRNQGKSASGGVQIAAATLNGMAAVSTVPLDIEAIPAGQSKAIVLRFAGNASEPGSMPVLRLTYTSANAGSGTWMTATGIVP